MDRDAVPADADLRDTVLIAGGGIAGLTMALTCHQVGVPCVVFESAREMLPLGVGINLQPNAVRELMDLGLGDDLEAIGLPTTEWALVGKNGRDVWSEPRGTEAGYRWPQYSVHRGSLQMMLYDAVIARLGQDSVRTGMRLQSCSNTPGGVKAVFEDRNPLGESAVVEVAGRLLLGADGLHSGVRATMYPDEGDPVWGGRVLWRGTAQGAPVRSGACFTLIGTLDQRFVHYPISRPDPQTGLQLQNWIAELTFDPDDGWRRSDWNQKVDASKFLAAFEDWTFPWLDVPAMVRSAEDIWEFPMVDRDPAPKWVDGNLALIGDAAHVMYPVGSNGASQAIVDARVLGRCFAEHGVRSQALQAFESELIEDMSALVLRNRGDGPVAILGVVDERCNGVFDNINDVIPRAEIAAFMDRYKSAAGFARDTLNASAPIISR